MSCVLFVYICIIYIPLNIIHLFIEFLKIEFPFHSLLLSSFFWSPDYLFCFFFIYIAGVICLLFPLRKIFIFREMLIVIEYLLNAQVYTYNVMCCAVYIFTFVKEDSKCIARMRLKIIASIHMAFIVVLCLFAIYIPLAYISMTIQTVNRV